MWSNLVAFAVRKEKKEFTTDMKESYHAAALEAAEMALDRFEKKWNNKNAYAIKSWHKNCEELTRFFEYPVEIRKIVYTTSIIESILRQNLCSRTTRLP